MVDMYFGDFSVAPTLMVDITKLHAREPVFGPTSVPGGMTARVIATCERADQVIERSQVPFYSNGRTATRSFFITAPQANDTQTYDLKEGPASGIHSR